MSRAQHVKIVAALGASTFVHLAVFAAVGTETTTALVQGGRAEIQYGTPPGAQVRSKRAEDAPPHENTSDNNTVKKDPEQLPLKQPVAEKPAVDPPKARSPIPETQPAEPDEDRMQIEPATETSPPETTSEEAPQNHGHPKLPDGADEQLQQTPDHPDDMSREQASTKNAPPQTAERSTVKPGNADSSNYAGLVMRHLSQVRRPRASSPGTAHVAFTIGDEGEIKNIRIAKSSRSARFDRDALKVVRRAAPFPPPPHGVNRSFSIEIEGH